MAGIASPGGAYYYNGYYGTAEQHAARQKAQQTQAPYDASKPSAGAAGTAASTTNPNLDFNISPTGATSLSNTSAQQRQTMDYQAELARQQSEWDRQNAMMDRNSFLAHMNTSQAAPQPVISHPGINSGMEADARAAAFSRAKDQAGQVARSSLTAIAEQMASKGMTGAGYDALLQAGAIGQAANPLLDLTRDQQMNDVQRAGQVADLDYTGRVTQRGQDLQNRQSFLSLLGNLY